MNKDNLLIKNLISLSIKALQKSIRIKTEKTNSILQVYYIQ